MLITRKNQDLVVFSFALLAVVCLGALLIFLLMFEPGKANRRKSINQTYYPEPIAKAGYTLTKTQIGERKIAAYVLNAASLTETKRPAVILIHGGSILDSLTFSKPQYKGEWFIPLFEDTPYRLAAAGMLVVAIDAWWAGERHLPKHEELARANPMAAVLHGYVETSYDVSQVIDYLLTREDIDPSRIGVAGRSGGGIISLMSACNDDRVQTVVAWKAGADFVELSHLRGESVQFNQAMNNDSGFRQELQQTDPIYHYQKIPPKALALIGNLNDPLMPRQGAQKLYDKLRPLYETVPDRLMIKLFETPIPTHDLQPEAFALGCAWFEKHLGRKSVTP
jgi:dienelactone hydrolase